MPISRCAAAAEIEPAIGRPVTGAIALVVDEGGHSVRSAYRVSCSSVEGAWRRGVPESSRANGREFTPSPLVSGRLYHTGDLVRWRADEQLEYLGRIDHQIKIRGFRVELGEIETRLRAQPSVDDVIVVLRDQASENPRIVAYVVGAATPEQLRAALAGLPAYMVPGRFRRTRLAAGYA